MSDPIPHSGLLGSLHPSRVLTFTGSPSSYSPPVAGVLVMATDTSLLYRSTGTGAGALQEAASLSGTEIVSLLAALTGGDRLSYTALKDTPTTGASGIPGEFVLYAGTLDSNNPALIGTSYSGNLLNLQGSLWAKENVSIGSASSGANIPDARCESLYRAVWGRANITVTGGKGASSAADWAANKALTLPRFAGRAIAAEGSGSGLTTRAGGALWGSETASLSAANNGSHFHTFGETDANTAATGGANRVRRVIGGSVTTDTSGSGTPFSIEQPSVAAGLVIWALGVLA